MSQPDMKDSRNPADHGHYAILYLYDIVQPSYVCLATCPFAFAEPHVRVTNHKMGFYAHDVLQHDTAGGAIAHRHRESYVQ